MNGITPSTQSAKKVALVIGNSYSGASQVTGTEDARRMAERLGQIGFSVLKPIFDGKANDILAALDALRAAVAKAEVVLFYFSGHGYQLNGKNYLLPVGAAINPTSPQVGLDKVIRALGGAPDSAVKLVFLDACRTNADLSLTNGGRLRDAPGWGEGLAKPPAEIPLHTLFSYAAAFGRSAQSGAVGGISPYTGSVLGSIREPGLEIRQFLNRVHDTVHGVTDFRQSPTSEGIDRLPKEFFLRPPVLVPTTIDEADNDLFVFLHGEIVMTASKQREKPLQLRAGDNPLLLMVSKAKSFHNNHDWSITEGWHYKMRLKLPNGSEEKFEDVGESVPFKGGPHHGAVFVVATANLYIDPDSPQVSVEVRDKKLNVWQQQENTPFWARDQDVLFKQKVTDLNLTPDDILGSAVNLGPLAPLLRPLLAEFLKTGMLFGAKLADPANTFVTVRGNGALKSVVELCMTEQRTQRISDLKASMAAVFNRVARPFDLFDQGLIDSIRSKAPDKGIKEPSENLLIWTALEEAPSQGAAALAAPTFAARAVAAPGGGAAELLALAQDSLLHPRPDEVLLGPSPLEQVVQGVPVSAQVYTFLSIQPADDALRFHARVVADLSDLQNKIGPLIDTIPLPRDNCSHFGDDNVVARIWGKAITVDGNTATLTLHGDVDVWTCRKNLIPCTRVDWVDQRGPFGVTIRVPQVVTFDCNPPNKNRNLNQPFDATIPFSVERVDSRIYALKLGEPQVNLGGTFGGVAEGILRIAGVDINARVKEALDRAIKPELLKQTLPDFLLPLDPSLTRAELVSNSGALALALEMDVTLDFLALGELIRRLVNP